MLNRLQGALGGAMVSSREVIVLRDPKMGARTSGRLAAMDECGQELGLNSFPNDLTRMLYLASLRDCNSGQYLHPQLSARMGIQVANQALLACHDQVFRRLLAVPVCGYVHQLDEYIRYTRMERTVVLKTWQSLQAYRATVPLPSISLYSELFCLNVEAALLILRPEDGKTRIRHQDAASR